MPKKVRGKPRRSLFKKEQPKKKVNTAEDTPCSSKEQDHDEDVGEPGTIECETFPVHEGSPNVEEGEPGNEAEIQQSCEPLHMGLTTSPMGANGTPVFEGEQLENEAEILQSCEPMDMGLTTPPTGANRTPVFEGEQLENEANDTKFCDPTVVDSEASPVCGKRRLVIHGELLENKAEEMPKLSIVSDIIVIEDINVKTNEEKPWFSLKDPTPENTPDVLTPTCVLVLPGPSASVAIEDCVGQDLNMDEELSTVSHASPSSPDPLDVSASTPAFSPRVSCPNYSPPCPGIVHSSRPSGGDGGGPSTDLTSLLLKVKEYLLLLLPSRWTPFLLHDGVHVGLLADVKPTVLQRSLFFSSDGSVLASVNGKVLPADHRFWQDIPKLSLNAESIKEYSELICKIVNRLRSYEICKGVEEFEDLWKKEENAEIDYNRFSEHRFQTTCRSSECGMTVPSLKMKRCSKCAVLWLKLQRRHMARQANTNTPDRSVPYSKLNTPQKRKRDVQKKREIKRLKVANAKYRKKMDELINTEGIDVDADTSDHFMELLTDKKEHLTDFQQLFIEQQIKASSLKGASGMRWHPAMIRLALSISMTSPAAYDELSGFIKLPSRRQLFDYSHAMESKEGCHDGIINHYRESFEKKCRYQFQNSHILKFDEVQVKKNLVLRKETGELVGYVKMSEVEKELATLKDTLTQLSVVVEGSDEPPPPPPREPPLVTKMLAYQVTNAATGDQAVVACYGVHNLNAENLYNKTWDVVGTLERAGLAVLAAVCDGASMNSAFFQKHLSLTQTNSGVVFDTVNIYAPHRKMYFLSDAPHLLKTARNCLFQSGKPSKRKNKSLGKKSRGKKQVEKEPLIRHMKKNGQDMQWKTVVRIYNELKGNTLRTAYKLNQEDVYLTPYSIMRVSLAAHVLSRSLATEIRLRGWTECSELANFCECMNDIFDMLNGKSAYQDVRTRNDLLAPYSSPDDFRFHLLLEKWRYFEEWAEEIKALPPSVSSAERGRTGLSRQTQQGLERTIRGFRGVVLGIVTLGVSEGQKPVILARRLQQDDVEHYFSKQRALLGGNRHPDIYQALQSNVAIQQQKQLGVKGAKRGNTAVNRTPTVAELSDPLVKRKVKRSLIGSINQSCEDQS